MTFEVVPADDARLEASADLAVAVRQLGDAVVTGVAREHRDHVLSFIGGHADAAQRANQVGHLTGSALVVDSSATHTLLMLHRKLGRWFQPGGHADGDTNLAAVALREASEETGIEGLAVVLPAIDVDVHRVEPPSEPAHLHLDVRYVVLAPPGAVETANAESLALRWVQEEALDTLHPALDESTRRLVHRGLEVAQDLVVSPRRPESRNPGCR